MTSRVQSVCRGGCARDPWLLGIVALTAIAGMGQAAYGQTLSASVSVLDPSPLVIGQTGAQATFSIQNTSSGTSPVTVTNIQLLPACDNHGTSFNGLTDIFTCAGTAYSGAISLGPTGTGVSNNNSANATCNGTWNISPIGSAGNYSATGPSGNLVVLTSPQETCTITFIMNAVMMPSGFTTTANVVTNVGAVISATALGTGNALGPDEESGSSPTLLESCSATLDKQVSCDGGATWEDVLGADDPTGALTNGCIANSGAAIMTRFIVNNTGGAFAGVSGCMLSDSPAMGNPLTFLTGTTSLGNLCTTATFVNSMGKTVPVNPACTAPAAMSTTTGNANMCTLTMGQNGTNTASLAGCFCPTTTNNVPVPTQTDTATFGCAGVLVDKEISCKAGASNSFTDVGLVSADQDGHSNGCTAITGVAGQIVAKFLTMNTGNAGLTCSLADTNAKFISSPIGSVSPLSVETTIATTSAMECSAALGGGEPDTATLTCTPNTASIAVGAGSIIANDTGVSDAGTFSVFDAATFGCTTPTPGFNASKTCTLTNPATSAFSVGVTVANTDSSGATSLSCTIADQTFAGNSGNCPATLPDGPPVSVTSPLTIGASGSGCQGNGAGCTSATATGAFTSSTPVCNQATVTCTPTLIATSTTLPVLTAQMPTAQCTPISQGGSIKIKKAFLNDTVASGGITTLTFTVFNTGGTALTGIGFTDTFSPLQFAATPSGPTATCGGTFTVTSTEATFSGGTLAAGASCSMAVTLTAVTVATPTEVCDTTSDVTSDQVSSTPAFACITIGSTTPIAPGDSFQVNYANVQSGDSIINITNNGASGGSICANIYVFDPSEEMLSCCSCLISPNGLAHLSVNGDLLSNPLELGPKPDSVVVKVLANAPDPGLCDAGTPGFQNLTPGLRAWRTSIHAVTGASSGMGITEQPFSLSAISTAELNHITAFCSFIETLHGAGVCKSCEPGALGAAAQK